MQKKLPGYDLITNVILTQLSRKRFVKLTNLNNPTFHFNIISKVIEKILPKKLQQIVANKEVISSHQFRF